MTVNGLTPDELAEALWRSARGSYAREAAVGLIIDTQLWLRRTAFLDRVTVDQDQDTGHWYADVDWPKIPRAALSSGASEGEKQILRCAAGLAGEKSVALIDLINSQDHANLAHLLAALAHARGWHETDRSWTVDGRLGDRVEEIDRRVKS